MFLFYLTFIFSTSDSKSSSILHIEMAIMCLPSILNSSLLENKLLTFRLRKDYPTKRPQIYLHLYYRLGSLLKSLIAKTKVYEIKIDGQKGGEEERKRKKSTLLVSQHNDNYISFFSTFSKLIQNQIITTNSTAKSHKTAFIIVKISIT